MPQLHMIRMTYCSVLAGALAAMVLLAGSPAAAASMTFKASLSGGNEVPPIAASGNGSLTANYDPATKVLTYTATYSGLSGPVTAAHFHGPSDDKHNAPVMVPVTGSLASPMKGTAMLTDAQAAALTSGRMYFNVHTAQHKPGEIRGQVTADK